MDLYQFDQEYKAKRREEFGRELFLVGVDEAGRGPLAGPLVAAAVYFPDYHKELAGIQDSKKLSEKKREELFHWIEQYGKLGIGRASVEEIEELNILNATFLAMRRALENLKSTLGEIEIDVLVDGNFKIRSYEGLQEPLVKGDAKSLAIAAASIVAKVTRDRELMLLAEKYPDYGFEKHKGYGTKLHREKITSLGLLEGVHRRSFLKKILGEGDGK